MSSRELHQSSLLIPSDPDAVDWLTSLVKDFTAGEAIVVQQPAERGGVAEDALLVSKADGAAYCVRVIRELPAGILIGLPNTIENAQGFKAPCPFLELLDGRIKAQEWLADALDQHGTDLMVGACMLLPEEPGRNVTNSALASLPLFTSGAALFAEDLHPENLSENGLLTIIRQASQPHIIGTTPLPTNAVSCLASDEKESGIEIDELLFETGIQAGERIDLPGISHRIHTMVTGLTQEIGASSRNPSSEYRLEDGRRITGKNSSRSYYVFQCNRRVPILADTPIKLVSSGEEWDGELVSVEGTTVVLSFSDDLGSSVHSAVMYPDATFILKAARTWLSSLASWFDQPDHEKEKSRKQEQGAPTSGDRAVRIQSSEKVKQITLPSEETEEEKFWARHKPNLTLMSAVLGGGDHSRGENRKVAKETKNAISALQGGPFPPNRSQLKAMERTAEREFHVIWGPPGTGKTANLAQVVRMLAVEQKKRVLVLAHANVAVDEAMLRVSHAFSGNSLLEEGRVIRVGNIRKKELLRDEYVTVDAQLRRKHPDLIIEKDDLSAERQRLTKQLRRARAKDKGDIGEALKAVKERLDVVKQLIRQKENELIGDAMVLGTTLSKLVISGLIFSKPVDAVIADEASMAPFPLVFLAAARSSEKALIFGDFRQLGPICLSTALAARTWLDKDVFDISDVTSKIDSSGRDPRVTLLDTQYRMAEPIAQIVSEFSYSGRLQSDLAASEKNIELAVCEPFPGEPLVLADTTQLKASCITYSGFSRVNVIHAIIAVQLACRAIDSGCNGVALVSPYREQAALMQNMIERLQLSSSALAATVHTFQGAEKDCIIFDLTDGFPQDRASRLTGNRPTARRLLNVAASRAKGKLVFLADLSFVRAIHPPDSFSREFVELLGTSSCVQWDLQPDLLESLSTGSKGFSFSRFDRLPELMKGLLGTGVRKVGINLPFEFLTSAENEHLASSLDLSASSIVFIDGRDKSAGMWDGLQGGPASVAFDYLPGGFCVSVPGRGLMLGIGAKEAGKERALAVTTDSPLSATLHHTIFGKMLDIPRPNVESSEGLDRTLGHCPDCGRQRRIKKARFGNQWIIVCPGRPNHTVVEADEKTLREIVGWMGITCPDCDSKALIIPVQDGAIRLVCGREGGGCGGVPPQLEDCFAR